MIDIDNAISSNNSNNENNGNAQPTPLTPNGASSVDDADKISPVPFAATTMTTAMLLISSTANNSIVSNDNYSGHHFFESPASYANGFNIETIVLLLMFSVCTIIYSSKYQISPPSPSSRRCSGGEK